jgi:TolA-binding protein
MNFDPSVLGKLWLPVLASNRNMDSCNPNEKTSMRTSILVAAIVACALAAPIVSAQEKSAPAKLVISTDMEQQISQMQENIEKMQQQMEKLRSITDPKERRKLMQEHVQAMQENMKTIRDMGGPTMDGQKSAGGSDMMQQHEKMEEHRDVMQKLMD